MKPSLHQDMPLNHHSYTIHDMKPSFLHSDMTWNHHSYPQTWHEIILLTPRHDMKPSFLHSDMT